MNQRTIDEYRVKLKKMLIPSLALIAALKGQTLGTET